MYVRIKYYIRLGQNMQKHNPGFDERRNVRKDLRARADKSGPVFGPWEQKKNFCPKRSKNEKKTCETCFRTVFGRFWKIDPFDPQPTSWRLQLARNANVLDGKL